MLSMLRGGRRLPTLRNILSRVHLRLILFAVVLASGSLVLSGMIVIRSYAQRNLTLISHTVGYTVEPAVLFDDRQAIRDGVVSVGAVSGVDRVEVHSPSGQVLARWVRPHSGLQNWLAGTVNMLIWPQPSTTVIRRNALVIGEVRVYGDSSGIVRYGISGLVIALSCMVLTVVATRILARRLQQDVVAPLEQVAMVARAVRSDRAFEKRVPSSGINEIDRFGQDFNALLAELQGWHIGLTSESAELARRATHDALTGLGNRVLLNQTLEDAIAEAVHSGQPCALVSLNISQFRQVNQRYGRECGDAVLIAVAERLRQSIRYGDPAFRVGGDAFAAVLLANADHDAVNAVLSRIATAMERPYRLPTGAFASSSLDAGVAVYPDDGLSPEDLVRKAEADLHDRRNPQQPAATGRK